MGDSKSKKQRKKVKRLATGASWDCGFPFGERDWKTLREFYANKQRPREPAYDLYWARGEGRLWVYAFTSIYVRPFGEPRQVHLERVYSSYEPPEIPEFEEWVESIAQKLRGQL